MQNRMQGMFGPVCPNFSVFSVYSVVDLPLMWLRVHETAGIDKPEES
jgi:hypothetical protein